VGGQLARRDPGGVAAEGAPLPDVQHGLEQRPHPEVVVGRQQVLGAAEERRPDHEPLVQQPRQVVQREALDPAPQPEIRQLRILPLHPDQVLDHGQGRSVDPGQQTLPGEGGPVQLTIGEHVHAARVPPIAVRN
jgi:hypothetical protein